MKGLFGAGRRVVDEFIAATEAAARPASARRLRGIAAGMENGPR